MKCSGRSIPVFITRSATGSTITARNSSIRSRAKLGRPTRAGVAEQHHIDARMSTCWGNGVATALRGGQDLVPGTGATAPQALLSDTGAMSQLSPKGHPPRAFMPPPVIPDDVDDPEVSKAAGVVTLPHRVQWSGPQRTYDLNDRLDRARVYEQVLREGLEEDVRYFIDVDQLIDLWHELFLPPHVRNAWAEWLAAHREVGG